MKELEDKLQLARESAVKYAIKLILEDTAKYKTSLNYAINYCKAAIGMRGEALQTQCLYILGNITHWRNPRASEIRQVLKNYTKCTITTHRSLNE